MRVVSNIYSTKPKIHFEAPPAVRVAAEMSDFLDWFNNSHEQGDPLLRAARAHIWFVTIHPMDGGNGRIARAIADLAVAQMERSGQRFYSMSSQIEREKAKYYSILEETQKGELDITRWMSWFIDCYARAIETAEMAADNVIGKAKFWQAHAAYGFSDRQRKVLQKLLDGFDGALTSKKFVSICGCSPDTAQRDIAHLVACGLLVRNAAQLAAAIGLTIHGGMVSVHGPHPPYDFWVTADDDAIFVKGGVGSYNAHMVRIGRA
jgi:Fic family protein